VTIDESGRVEIDREVKEIEREKEDPFFSQRSFPSIIYILFKTILIGSKFTSFIIFLIFFFFFLFITF
jgi:hypothetical protein